MKNRIKEFYRYKPNIIDTIFIGVVILIFLVEINRNSLFNNFTNNDFFIFIRNQYHLLKTSFTKITSAIVITLLPLIFTNIFISIQMLKEKRAGISIGELRELRGKSIYSLFRMAIIICISFALYGMFALLELSISMLILNCLSLFYAVFFSIQEIPVLTNNKRAIMRIIEKEYSNIFSQTVVEKRGYLPSSPNNCVKAINYYVLTLGLDGTYKNFKSSDSIIIEDLIAYQVDYFKRLYDALDNDLNVESEFEGTNIYKAIAQAYINIDDIFVHSDYELKVIKDNIDTLITNVLFLHKVCEYKKITNIERNGLDEIVSSILINDFSDDRRAVLIEFLLKLSILTLKDGRDWFVKRLRDNHFYPQIIFDKKSYNIGLFLSIFIAHIYGNKLVDINKALVLNHLIFEKTCGLNSYGASWASVLSSWIERDQLEESIDDLFKCYDMLSDNYYSFFFEGRSSGNNDFTKKVLFNAWLEIILLSDSCYRVDDKKVNDVLEKLSTENRSILIDSLSYYWIKDDKIKYIGERSFLGTFKMNSHTEIMNDAVSKSIYNFRKKYLEMEYIPGDENSNNLSHDYIKKHLCEAFTKLSKTEFMDNKVPLENQILYFPFVLENEEYSPTDNQKNIKMNNLIDALDGFIPHYFNSFMQSSIVRRLEPIIINERSIKIDSDEYKKIIDFKPDIISSFNYDINEKIGKSARRIFNSFLPKDLYCKNNAIKYNVKFYKTYSKASNFTDADALNYLNDNYEMVNGLYRYSPYSNDNTHSILMTREKLLELIKKKYFIVRIAFKFGIEVDSNKCLWFKYEDMND